MDLYMFRYTWLVELTLLTFTISAFIISPRPFNWASSGQSVVVHPKCIQYNTSVIVQCSAVYRPYGRSISWLYECQSIAPTMLPTSLYIHDGGYYILIMSLLEIFDCVLCLRLGCCTLTTISIRAFITRAPSLCMCWWLMQSCVLTNTHLAPVIIVVTIQINSITYSTWSPVLTPETTVSPCVLLNK